MSNYFYKNIKYLRQKKYKMSMEKFGNLLDTSSSNISRWENGNNGATIDLAYQISKKLNIPIYDLIGDDLEMRENVVLDENHILDNMIVEKTYSLSEEDKKRIINIIDAYTDKK